MDLYVIRRPSAWASLKEVEAVGAKSAQIGNDEMSDRVRWIRSYVVKEPDGRFGSVCIYQARDPESIREHARRVERRAVVRDADRASGSASGPRGRAARRARVVGTARRIPPLRDRRDDR